MKVLSSESKSLSSEIAKRAKKSSKKIKADIISANPPPQGYKIAPFCHQENQKDQLSWAQVIARLAEENSEIFNEHITVNPALDKIHPENFKVEKKNETIDFLMILGKDQQLDLGLIGNSKMQIPVPFTLSTIYSAKPFKSNFKINEFSHGKFMFLGQVGFYYNVHVIFTPAVTFSGEDYVPPRLIEKENAAYFYDVIKASLQNIAGTGVLPNGILIDKHYCNLFEESQWEFDLKLLESFSESLLGTYVEMQRELLYDDFFKRHHARIVVSKYGQNTYCGIDVLDSFVENISSWFNFSKCSKLYTSVAKNYEFSHRVDKLYVLFDKKQLETMLGCKLDFYGKAFSKDFGNFQLSEAPKRMNEIITSFSNIIQKHDPSFDSSDLSFAGLQGYSGLKTILRKRSWEEPFYNGNLTKALCRTMETSSAKEKRMINSAYEEIELGKAMEKVEMSCFKNQDLRIEIGMALEVQHLFQKGGAIVVVNTILEAANYAIDSLFNFEEDNVLNVVAVFPTQVFPGIMLGYLGYIGSKMQTLITRHRSKGFLTISDLELLSILERLAQYLFSGSPKKLPTLLLRELGCLRSLDQQSIPFFYRHLLPMEELDLNLLKTWETNPENMRIYHIAQLEDNDGQNSFGLYKAFAECEIMLSIMLDNHLKEEIFFRAIVAKFTKDIFLREFATELYHHILQLDSETPNESYTELAEKLRRCLEEDAHWDELDEEEMILLQPLLKGQKDSSEFTKLFFDTCFHSEKWHKKVSKKNMIFPRMLEQIYKATQCTKQTSFNDFVYEFSNSLNKARFCLLPFISMKNFQLSFWIKHNNQTVVTTMPYTNFWKRITPIEVRSINHFDIPNFQVMFDDICEKFPFIPTNIFDFLNTDENAKDAEAMMKCGFLAYRFYTKGRHDTEFKCEFNSSSDSTRLYRTVYSLILYIAVKINLQSVIQIFKDRKGSKNLAHTKVKVY